MKSDSLGCYVLPLLDQGQDFDEKIIIDDKNNKILLDSSTSQYSYSKFYPSQHSFKKVYKDLIQPLVHNTARGAASIFLVGGLQSSSFSKLNSTQSICETLISEATNELISLLSSSSASASGGKKKNVTMSWYKIDSSSSESIVDILKTASSASSSSGPSATSTLTMREGVKNKGMVVPGLWEVEVVSGKEVTLVMNRVISSLSSLASHSNGDVTTILQLSVGTSTSSNSSTSSSSTTSGGKLSFVFLPNISTKINQTSSTNYWYNNLNNILSKNKSSSTSSSASFAKSRLSLLLRDGLLERHQMSSLFCLLPEEKYHKENLLWLDFFHNLSNYSLMTSSSSSSPTSSPPSSSSSRAPSTSRASSTSRPPSTSRAPSSSAALSSSNNSVSNQNVKGKPSTSRPSSSQRGREQPETQYEQQPEFHPVEEDTENLGEFYYQDDGYYEHNLSQNYDSRGGIEASPEPRTYNFNTEEEMMYHPPRPVISSNSTAPQPTSSVPTPIPRQTGKENGQKNLYPPAPPTSHSMAPTSSSPPNLQAVSNHYSSSMPRMENESALALALETCKEENNTLKISYNYLQEEYNDLKANYNKLLKIIQDSGGLLGTKGREKLKELKKESEDFLLYKNVLDSALLKLKQEINLLNEENVELKKKNNEKDKIITKLKNSNLKLNKNLVLFTNNEKKNTEKINELTQSNENLVKEKNYITSNFNQSNLLLIEKVKNYENIIEQHEKNISNLSKKILTLTETKNEMEQNLKNNLKNNSEEIEKMRQNYTKAIENLMNYQEENDCLRNLLLELPQGQVLLSQFMETRGAELNQNNPISPLLSSSPTNYADAPIPRGSISSASTGRLSAEDVISQHSSVINNQIMNREQQQRLSILSQASTSSTQNKKDSSTTSSSAAATSSTPSTTPTITSTTAKTKSKSPAPQVKSTSSAKSISRTVKK